MTVNAITKQDQNWQLYSDMYKDAYGFRPHTDCSNWSDEQFQKEFDFLQMVIEADIREELSQQNQTIEVVEKHIVDMINFGANDRETAIRWLHDAHDTNGDADYLCFTLGLPYGYFNVDKSVN